MVSGLQSYLLPIYSSATVSIRAVITRLFTQPCWYRSRLIICKFASIFLVLPVTIASASRPQHLNSSPVHSYEISLFLVPGNSLDPLDQPTSTDLPVSHPPSHPACLLFSQSAYLDFWSSPTWTLLFTFNLKKMCLSVFMGL